MALEVFLNQFNGEYNKIIDDLKNLVKDDKSLSEVEKSKTLTLSNQYESITNRIVILQKYFTDNTPFIPAYEVRKAQESLSKLNKLSQEKRDELFPKKKFGFKSKQNMTTLESAIQTSESLTKENDSKKTLVEFNIDSSCAIKDLINENIIKYGEEINGKDIGIVNVKNSIIQLMGNPSVLHADNIENTTILCGPISGSVFVNNLKNTNLIIACHQLRIHETHKSKFYVHLGSRAIIENCSDAKFAPYAWSYPDLEKDFDKCGFSLDKLNWNCIDDFNWLNQNQKSPNWDILQESDRLKWISSSNGELKTE